MYSLDAFQVQIRGRTTYNEVADALVNELTSSDSLAEDGGGCDEKNIRRRVYDAINVLMAMDIMTKESKAIIWRGFPNMSKDKTLDALRAEHAEKVASLEQKQQLLQVRWWLVSCSQFAGVSSSLFYAFLPRGSPPFLPLPCVLCHHDITTTISGFSPLALPQTSANFSLPYYTAVQLYRCTRVPQLQRNLHCLQR